VEPPLFSSLIGSAVFGPAASHLVLGEISRLVDGRWKCERVLTLGFCVFALLLLLFLVLLLLSSAACWSVTDGCWLAAPFTLQAAWSVVLIPNLSLGWSFVCLFIWGSRTSRAATSVKFAPSRSRSKFAFGRRRANQLTERARLYQLGAQLGLAGWQTKAAAPHSAGWLAGGRSDGCPKPTACERERVCAKELSLRGYTLSCWLAPPFVPILHERRGFLWALRCVCV